jgi:hypothetical protein
VSVYKGSTTESTAGVTLTVDYDSRTGLHDVVIDTSADGTFYAAGNDFDVILTAGTVDSISVVGTVIGTFSLANRAALRPTTADRTLDVSATGEAGIDWANVGSPTTTLNLSGTTIKTATDVETDTADIQGRLPAALVSGRMDASVGAMAANTLTASALAADAVTEIQSGLASQASVNTIDDFLDTEVAAIKAKTDNLPDDPADASVVAGLIATAQAVLDKLDDTLEDDAGTYRFTTNALEQAPAGGGGSTDWTADERTAIRTILGVPASGTTPDAPSAGALKVIDDFLDTEVSAILADTNELQTDLADGGRLDALIDAIKAKTDGLPSDPADASVIATSFGSVTTQLNLIQAKTDNLPTDPADASVIAGRFDTVDSAIAAMDFPGVPANFELLSISEDGVVKGFPSELDGTAIAGQALSVNGSGEVNVNMAQAVPTSNTAQTHGDCLNASRAQGFGKWVLVGTTLTLYAGDGTTPVRQFTLAPGATSPTSRT